MYNAVGWRTEFGRRGRSTPKPLVLRWTVEITRGLKSDG